MGALPAGGATITGTFSGASDLSTGVRVESVSASVTVTVQGTGITATVGPHESFTLANVPTGDVTLVFSGSFTGQFTIPSVQSQEQIRVAVSARGSSVTLAITERTEAPSNQAQMEGTVTSVNATARTIVVGGATISVPASAVIGRGEASLTFGKLTTGERVHVSGMFSGSTLIASEIMVQGMDN
jgi:hypothetical protein